MSFKNKELTKHATEPTYKLLEAMRWAKLQNWKPISVGDTIKLGHE